MLWTAFPAVDVLHQHMDSPSGSILMDHVLLVKALSMDYVFPCLCVSPLVPSLTRYNRWIRSCISPVIFSTKPRSHIIYRNLQGLHLTTLMFLHRKCRHLDSLNLPRQLWLNLRDHLPPSYLTTIGINSCTGAEVEE